MTFTETECCSLQRSNGQNIVDFAINVLPFLASDEGKNTDVSSKSLLSFGRIAEDVESFVNGTPVEPLDEESYQLIKSRFTRLNELGRKIINDENASNEFSYLLYLARSYYNGEPSSSSTYKDPKVAELERIQQTIGVCTSISLFLNTELQLSRADNRMLRDEQEGLQGVSTIKG